MSKRGSKLSDDIFSTGAYFVPFAIKIINNYQNKKNKKQQIFNSLPKDKQNEILLVRFSRYQNIAKYTFLIFCALEVFAILTGHFSTADINAFIPVIMAYGIFTYKKKNLTK